MIVRVRCLVPLDGQAAASDRLELPEGATAGDAADTLHVPPEAIGTLLRNDVPVERNALLAHDDRLTIIPPISGG